MLTCSPTGIGKFIQLVTHFPFSHVSIALSDHPDKFYSFARYYQCAPFYAGFTVESAMRYKGHDVPVRVYRVPISDLQMTDVRSILQSPDFDREKYIYNLFSPVIRTSAKSARSVSAVREQKSRKKLDLLYRGLILAFVF